MKGNYSDAIQLYSKAIELDGANAIYFSNRAQALIMLEEFAKAIEDCDTAIKINPNHTKVSSESISTSVVFLSQGSVPL